PETAHGVSEQVEAHPDVADRGRGEGRRGPRRPGHRFAPRDVASRRRSANTPPAVTSGPAPGPCTTSGFGWYRRVLKRTMLSVAWIRANGWSSGYARRRALARPSLSTAPT